MTYKEITKLSDAELIAKRREIKQEVLNLRVQQATGQLQNSARITILRKDIARIETLLTQKRA